MYYATSIAIVALLIHLPAIQLCSYIRTTHLVYIEADEYEESRCQWCDEADGEAQWVEGSSRDPKARIEQKSTPEAKPTLSKRGTIWCLKLNSRVNHWGYYCNKWQEKSCQEAGNVDVLVLFLQREVTGLKGKANLPEEIRCMAAPPDGNLLDRVNVNHACML